MRILTGSTGTNHITAADDGALYAGIVGSGSYVLDIGRKFEATVLSSVAIMLDDGDGILQGRHFRTDTGDSDTVAIEENSAGTNRNDIIGVRYNKNAGVESMEWRVVKGTPSASTAEDPSYSAGNLLGGDTEAFMPMYRVRLTGVSITAVEPLFEVLTSVSDHVADQDNPHGVTTDQIGAAQASHAHGNITSAGAIGSTADRIVVTGTSGKLTAVTPASAREKLGLAAVAASGSYNDLADKPTIPESLTVDGTVTATGANPVSGKAVSDYAQPKVTSGTDDLTAGSSALATGEVYLVYE